MLPPTQSPAPRLAVRVPSPAVGEGGRSAHVVCPCPHVIDDPAANRTSPPRRSTS